MQSIVPTAYRVGATVAYGSNNLIVRVEKINCLTQKI